MSKQAEFVERMKSLLAKATAELHRLESRTEDLQSNASDKYRQAIDELHEKRIQAEDLLKNIERARESVWEHHSAEIEKTWTAFRAGIDTLHDFSDHS